MDLVTQFGLIGFLALGGAYVTYKSIPQMSSMFIKSNLAGIDLCKKDRTRKIAESLGVVAGSVYLIILFLYIPIQFAQIDTKSADMAQFELFVQFLAALLSICCMLFLGFADDVLELRWRTKLLLPMIASLPLIMVYMLTYGNTTIIVPKPFRSMLGFSVDLGYLYCVFLLLIAVFCTNAINIVAGINGIEAGQGLMIGASIMSYNTIELLLHGTEHWRSHIFSLHMMLPFVAVTFALLYHNWYPSDVFVGDTYCYFAGMTFAVVGILGHFSKTMLLFFMPQVANFLYSCPQLFHFVDCPRHRLPKYDPDTDRLVPSTFTIDSTRVGTLGALMIRVLRTLALVRYRKISETKFECNNLTIINFLLIQFGPIKEKRLTAILLFVQFLGTLLAFGIRYGLSQIFY